ncbi:MAG: hypothetical protein ACP5SH_07700 [Syntrophobacteraceae bacterium]
MKKWCKYFLNIWTPVVIMVALNLYVWAGNYVNLNLCWYHDAAVLSHKQGKFDVVLRQSFCDRGCTEKIVFRRSLSDSGIFVYEPLERSSKPVVRWLGQDRLEIVMNEVSHIYTQRKEVHGIKITYRIGKVDDPSP